MRRLAPDRAACFYALTCKLGLTKIGVAPEPRQRLRALQVGSPVPLELGWFLCFERAVHAYAVLADVARQLAERRERGSWYRVSALEVRHAAGNRSAAQAPRETDLRLSHARGVQAFLGVNPSFETPQAPG